MHGDPRKCTSQGGNLEGRIGMARLALLTPVLCRDGGGGGEDGTAETRALRKIRKVY